jgi:hypothetical protein
MKAHAGGLGAIAQQKSLKLFKVQHNVAEKA